MGWACVEDEATKSKPAIVLYDKDRLLFGARHTAFQPCEKYPLPMTASSHVALLATK
jgi:hypothetical protein